MTTSVLCFFDINTAYLEKKDLHARKSRMLKGEKRLLCMHCRQFITHESDSVVINGQHIHTCMNPGGYEYTFGCYLQAPGCLAVGGATFDHTWFANYNWRIAICSGCHEHMGWLFSNEEHFFALIQEKLVRD